ncbi:hypothetical protein [Burkholderia sp. MSMB1072]|uniref:hypothetical protein n=1 Tax=Burkholderia sp. MSMB1072 TaxID=1637871 RepID=UPI0012E39015|nr:hypothetical protein [Burkholderia sp. MSMB1072]
MSRLQQVFSSKIDPHVRMPAWDAKQENRSDYVQAGKIMIGGGVNIPPEVLEDIFGYTRRNFPDVVGLCHVDDAY